MGLLILIAFIFPKNGIKITKNFSLRFFSIQDILSLNVENQRALEILNINTDTAIIIQPKRTPENATRYWHISLPGKLIYPENNPRALEKLFSLFKRLAEKPTSTGDSIFHILHYGDSQIEGDRISGYLRHRLQALFGGSGAGLIPAVQPISARNVKQSASENWIRYTLFGPREQRAPDNLYGVLLSKCTYKGDTASIILNRSSSGYPGVKSLQKIRIFLKPADSLCEVKIKGKNEYKHILRKDAQMVGQIIDQTVNWGEHGLEINFNGAPPEIFAIELQGEKGIQVDNLPMRGASGTFFSANHTPLFKEHLKTLNVRLFILEFGGNILPHIETEKQVTNYAATMEKQFKYLMKCAPEASLIVIGPSDMAVKIGGVLNTHPWLEKVRHALRSATLNAGGVFWDMYEAMGGRGSMILWVNATPPLASQDYIHFTSAGAEKIAGMFTSALIEDFNRWNAMLSRP